MTIKEYIYNGNNGDNEIIHIKLMPETANTLFYLVMTSYADNDNYVEGNKKIGNSIDPHNTTMIPLENISALLSLYVTRCAPLDFYNITFIFLANESEEYFYSCLMGGSSIEEVLNSGF